MPVFDLDNELHHEELFDGLNQFDKLLTEALEETGDLSTAELRSRDGAVSYLTRWISGFRLLRLRSAKTVLPDDGMLSTACRRLRL